MIDHQTNTKLASIVDYNPRGGLWWWGVLFGWEAGPSIGFTSCLGMKKRGDLIDEILVKPFVPDNSNNFDGRK